MQTGQNPFHKATKYESKLRLNIAGVAGSGKTFTSLAIASGLGARIALLDTEHGSASKYADIFEFDTLNLDPPYHPDHYIQAIHAAEEAGYDVLIIDSLSHAWSGAGGLLDIVDTIAVRSKNPNTFAAWKDATPIQNRLVEALLTSRLHIISTMRSKQDYIVETDDRGRQVPRKVGMAPVQRDGMEYEFDVFGEMYMDNSLVIQKSRCPALAGKVFKTPGKDVAALLAEWLMGEMLPSAAVSATPMEPPQPPSPQPNRSPGHKRHPESVADIVSLFDGTVTLSDYNAAVGLAGSLELTAQDQEIIKAAAEKARSRLQLTARLAV